MSKSSEPIENSQDVIDSRDVIARIEYLQELETRDEDEDAELKALQALASEADSSPDWKYGETLIRDSYFQDYAQELAEDCGMIPPDLKWPCNCIDWEKACSELKYDYSLVDFDGVDYWIRS